MKFKSRYAYREVYHENKPFDKHTGHLYPQEVYVNANSADRFVETLEICLIAEKAVQIAKKTVDNDTIIFKDRDRDRKRFYDNEGRFKTQGHQKAKIFSDAIGICEFFLNRFTPLNDEVLNDYLQAPKWIVDSELEYVLNPKDTESCGFTHEQITHIPRIGKGQANPIPRPVNQDGKISYNQVPSDRNPFLLYRDDGEYTLYVKLVDDPLPSELESLYTEYWKGKDESQLKAGSKLIPLKVLIDFLFEKFGPDSEAPDYLRRSAVVDYDDMSSHRIYAHDGTIERVQPRDFDLEQSQSDLGKICAVAGKDMLDLCYYARIIHCVLMGSICEKSRSQLTCELAFESERMFHLMDQRLFYINHPTRMIFTTEPEIMDSYQGLLSNAGMEMIDDYVEGLADHIGGEGGTDRVGVDWIRGKDLFRMRKDQFVCIPLLDYDVEQEENLQKLELLLRIFSRTESIPRDVILVTDRKSRLSLDKVVSRLQKTDNIRCIVVIGKHRYRTVREDLYNLLEVGITDVSELYSIQEDDEDIMRIVSVSELLCSQGLCECADAESAIEGLKELIGSSEQIEDELYRIPFEAAASIAMGMIEDEANTRRSVLGGRFGENARPPSRSI